MNIQKLIKAAQKPELYEKGTAVMWQDTHISGQLLETHLNPDIDLASRKESTILLTVDWLLDKAPGNRLNILDLGCGPGLYTEKFAEAGHRVTGIDFSAGSIRYARASAGEKGLDIDYREQDYLTLDAENEYDLVLMIFTDFGVLLPDERKRLLKKVHRALKPGGKFIFDVLNHRFSMPASREWDAQEKGFWKDAPYLALSENFHYEKEKVFLSQHIVMDEKANMNIYRFWTHTFSHRDLEAILSWAGFSDAKCHSGILPDGGGYRSEDVTFCIGN